MKIKKGDRYGTLTVMQASKSVIKTKTQRLNNGHFTAYKTCMTEVKCDCGYTFLAFTANVRRMGQCIKCKRGRHAGVTKDSWMKNENRLGMRIKSRTREIEDIEEKIYQWTLKAERLENEKAGFQKILESLND